MPSGTGKTVSLLALIVAYQRVSDRPERPDWGVGKDCMGLSRLSPTGFSTGGDQTYLLLTDCARD